MWGVLQSFSVPRWLVLRRLFAGMGSACGNLPGEVPINLVPC